jgi:hypothetical protein
MTKQAQKLIVRCPQCTIVIEAVTPETMVYCLTCRKWCREVEEARKIAPVAATPAPRPRRRMRCH